MTTEKHKKAQQIWYLKNREREREKRRKYYDENVKGTKRKNNPEAAKRASEKFRAIHNTERFCKCCKKTKSVELFEPRKHYCIKCAPKSKAESDKRYRKNLKIKEVKAIKLAEKQKRRLGIDLEKQKLRQKEWYEKRKKEKPVRIPKVKVERERKLSDIKMTDTRVYPRVRDVRKGWEETMAKLRAKFEIQTA